MKSTAAILLAAILLAGCATQTSSDKNAPAGPPSATFEVAGGSAAYWGSAGGGKGTINYKGFAYPFSVHSAGAGGVGGQKISASGEVYNLNRLSDFSGTYTGTRSGLTLVKGKMHAKMTNNKGVVIYVTGSTEGLASSLGASAVTYKHLSLGFPLVATEQEDIWKVEAKVEFIADGGPVTVNLNMLDENPARKVTFAQYNSENDQR